MRVFTLTAIFALLASAPAAAQVSPDSIRPQDTEPSIPVETPTLDEPAAGASAAGAQGAGQDPDTPVSSSDPAAGTAGDAGYVQGADGMRGAQASGAGLPERTAAPRTLRAHWHVYIAFTVAWVLLFGYAISIGLRMSRLEREISRQRGAG